MNFNSPFFNPMSFYNRRYNYPSYLNKNQTINNTSSNNIIGEKKYPDENTTNSSSEYFFELFGLHLYIDDIILICLLFFLYSENVTDDGIFICLILLLLTQ